MKAAVISDIHGNFQALECVMKDIEKQNVDKVFCLGDIALAGPEPVKVVDYVMSQNWEIIQGNTDQLIAEFSPELRDMVKAKYPMMANALADDVVILREDQKEYLKNLPAQKELEIEGVKVLLVHGSPRSNSENILPDLPIEQVEGMLEGTSADVIFCGHTHIPCGYQTSKRQTVINVGSVGRPMTDNVLPCYLIADFNNGGFSVEHRFVDYDRDLAVKLLSERGFEGADKIAKLLICPNEDRHV